MEESRTALFPLVCVLVSSVSGALEEMKVRPGDNITLYCDCALVNRHEMVHFKIFWVRRSSQQIQFPFHLTEDLRLEHYSLVWNQANKTNDLQVKTISESELGLYYCAQYQPSKDKPGTTFPVNGYHEGNRATLLTFHGDPCAKLSKVTAQTTAQTTTLTTHQTIPQTTNQTTPVVVQSNPIYPASDCGSYKKLMVILGPVCVLLSSVLSSTCVYCLCHCRTKGSEEKALSANVFQGDCIKEHLCEQRMKGELCLHTEVYFTPLKSK
ncbi:uncharacterized protein [Hoplias malabaricus]|uniref:uncharacterized protein n=1 Tax=Hoplias malabaricus TaxID=27720 RepID=UPI003462401F